VLDCLGGSKEPGVERRCAFELLHNFLAFLDNADDRIARFAPRRFVDLLEDFLEPRHVLFSLCLVRLESGLEILGLSSFREFRCKSATKRGSDAYSMIVFVFMARQSA
jgi:hypothetical protein